MNLILGIDTGGTYTDGVLVKYDSKEIVRGAKAFTTKEDLSVGIQNCIDNLEITEDECVCLVCLSTTLATNAVVEQKKSAIGLITVGSTLDHTFPVAQWVNVKGKMSILGCEDETMSEDQIIEALTNMKGKIDSLAISGYASVRNPEQELYIRKIAESILEVPIVCAHELTSSLGFYERTITATLNAKLIPIIKELVCDTKVALTKRNIDAPVCIVKGDGNLMVDSYAIKYPIETILSGPAASMIGGKFLTGLNDAIIVDMGGTTTDIVFIDNGKVIVNDEGASVGGWMTSVKAVNVNTFGSGGDSYLKIDLNGKITFGPRKVVPLCVAASENPGLYDEIEKYEKSFDRNYTFVDRQEADCVRLFKRNKSKDELCEKEREVLDLLEDGAHSVFYLSEQIGADIDSLGLEKLIDMELIQLISMTPTDILHASGEYREWNYGASILGAKLLSLRLGISVSDFLKLAEEQFVLQVAGLILQSCFYADGLNLDKTNMTGEHFLISHFIEKKPNQHFECIFQMDKPIVCLGAPTATWLSKVGKLINAELIFLDYGSVANAVGAAVGNVCETLNASIFYDPHIGKYISYNPKERKLFKTLLEAKEFSKKELKLYAEQMKEMLGIDKHEIEITEKDYYLKNLVLSSETFIKSEILAFISGNISVNKK